MDILKSETLAAPKKAKVRHETEAGLGSSGKKALIPFSPPDPVQEGDALLQDRHAIDVDETYGIHEQALNEFLKLHPMLSLESSSHRTLQLIGDLLDESSIPTSECEIVGKAHDDSMLRPANESIGERSCCLGDRCIAAWLARFRYGDDTEHSFVCTEFLLPSQKKEFDASGKLPEQHGKCLICTRYVTTYMYRVARADPTFRANLRIPVTAFGNVVSNENGVQYPTHCSVVADTVDGYAHDAMLFADEGFAETEAARTTMGTYLFRPVVRFCATHYKYVLDNDTGSPRILQVGVGCECRDEQKSQQGLADLHFQTPAPTLPG